MWPWVMSSRLVAATLAALSIALVAPGSAATAAGGNKVYARLDEALELAFPGCELERGTTYLTKEQVGLVKKLAGSKPASAIAHPYVARKDGRIVGTAYVETHRVRTLRESILIIVDPEQRVKRIEVLAFGEPEEYLARGAWYGQFVGRRLDDELRLKRGIRGITGATLTARATTDAVRRVLAVHQVLNPPPPPPPSTEK
jgi:electron transport complex protein RnfG